jgi:uncharacterized RDD family membrane protein YckC
MAESLAPKKSSLLLELPKLPVSGFFLRLFAFTLDFILLLAALHLVARNFEEFVFSLGRWAPYLSAGLFFFYLVLLNGPFGRGQTIGKMILGIRTTDYDGKVPTYRQALLRTIILVPTFVTAPLTALVVSPEDGLYAAYLYSIPTNLLMFSVIVATLLVIPFNPFKQGPHDFVAKTLVQGSRTDAVTFSDLREKLGAGWRPFYMQPQYSGAATIGLVMILLAVMLYPANFGEEQIRYRKALTAMAEVPGFAGSRVDSTPISKAMYDAFNSGTPYTEGADTTGTLQLVLQVSQLEDWKLDEKNPADQATALRFAQRYEKEVFPLLLAAVTASKEEHAQKIAANWQGRDIEWTLALHQQVSFKPYPLPSRERAFFSVKDPAVIEMKAEE